MIISFNVNDPKDRIAVFKIILQKLKDELDSL